MIKSWSCFSYLFLLIISLMSGCNFQKDKEETSENSNIPVIKPPTAPAHPYTYAVNGREITDNYHWLRDRLNPEVIDYLKAENAYADSIMFGTRKLQDTLFNEMKNRIAVDDATYPVKVDNYFYYSRTEKDKQYPIYCRKEGSLDSEEEVVLD